MSKLFSIEGIDFAGKTTQVAMLRHALEHAGHPVVSFKFPDESTDTGRLLRNLLNSSVSSLPTYALFALFAANRLERKEAIEQARSRGCVVLLDRYSESEYAYGQASQLPADWLFSLESPMPLADFVILLDIDPSMARGRGADLPSPRDAFESDITFQTHVREQYLRLAHAAPFPSQRWIVMNGERPAIELHQIILSEVLDTLAGKM